MSSTSLALQPPITRDESMTLVGRTMAFVAATVGTFALGAYLGRDWSSGSSWLLFFAVFAALIGINSAFSTVRRPRHCLATRLRLSRWAIAGSDTQLLREHRSCSAMADRGSDCSLRCRLRSRWIWDTARLSTLALLVSSGRSSRCSIVFGIVLIFVQIPHGSVIYAVLGLTIFAGLTAFDFQRLRRNRDIRSAPLLASSIFLDILNVFLLLLSLFTGNSE